MRYTAHQPASGPPIGISFASHSASAAGTASDKVIEAAAATSWS
jgi:hypothetical protein